MKSTFAKAGRLALLLLTAHYGNLAHGGLVLEQNFDGIPSNFSGTYGTREENSGEWVDLNKAEDFPQIQSDIAFSGNALKISGVTEEGRKVYCITKPLLPEQIAWEFKFFLLEKSSLSTQIELSNEVLASFSFSSEFIHIPDSNDPTKARAIPNLHVQDKTWITIRAKIDRTSGVWSATVQKQGDDKEHVLFNDAPVRTDLPGIPYILVFETQPGAITILDDIVISAIN